MADAYDNFFSLLDECDFEATPAPIQSHLRRGPTTEIPTINRQRYTDAFKKVRLGYGTAYPREIVELRQKDIDSLEPENNSCASAPTGNMALLGLRVILCRGTGNVPLIGKRISQENATVELEQALHSSSDVSSRSRDALNRLRGMIEAGDEGLWGPELVAKSFHDWDSVFFKGTLKGRCLFEWVTPADYGMGTKLGAQYQAGRLGVGYTWDWATIRLNADRILLHATPEPMRDGEAPVRSFRMMFGVLLHEMVHAYLAIRSGSCADKDEENEGFDGGHGRHFQRCIHAINGISRKLLGVAADDNTTSNKYKELKMKMFDMETHSLEPPRPSRWGLHKMMTESSGSKESEEPVDKGPTAKGPTDKGPTDKK